MDRFPVSIKNVLSITYEISLIHSVCIGSRNEIAIRLTLGLPRWLSGNEPAWQCRRGASVTGWEDPWRRKWQLSILALEIPWTEKPSGLYIVHGVEKELDMTEQRNKQQVLPLSERNPTALCCCAQFYVFTP